jgi:acyl carrier protein
LTEKSGGLVVKKRIREIIKSHVHLGVPVDSVADSSNLYSAGMTSHSSVVLMLALENEFGLEFPATVLNRSVFESIDSIAFTIDGLVASEAH